MHIEFLAYSFLNLVCDAGCDMQGSSECLVICYNSAISVLVSLFLFRIGGFFLGDRGAWKGMLWNF